MAENENNKVALDEKSAKVQKKQKAKKEKKPSKLATKLKNLKSEFKKITWATPQSTFKSFGIVLVGVVAAATVIGVIDFGLSSLFDFLLKTISFGL